jgi:hypothetical protein
MVWLDGTDWLMVMVNLFLKKVWQGNGQKIMRLSLLVVNVIAIHEKRQMTAKMAGNQTGTAFVLYIIIARHGNGMKGEELWR